MVFEKLDTAEIQISEYALVGRVEKQFFLFYETNDPSLPLLLDMSRVSYIQLQTQVYLAQLIYSRHLHNLKTQLRLPIDNDVKVIMFTWRFFEIIEELTGKNIYHFIEGLAKNALPEKYVIEDKNYYIDIRKDYFEKYYKEEQLQILVKKGFFSLVCEPFKEERQKYLALKKQTRLWSTEKLITDVLQRHLLEGEVPIATLLSNTIIFEILTNAANHPASDHLVIGSFYDFTKNKKTKEGDTAKKTYFTLIMWDDGESIVKTLLEAVQSGTNVRNIDSFNLAQKSGLMAWMRIIRKNYSSNSKNDCLFYDYLPDKESDSDEILLSSFMPGISRKPISKGKTENSTSSSEEDKDSSSGTGLGLTYLLRAVVQELNGTIHVRTEDCLLELARARTGGSIEHNDKLFYKSLNSKEKKQVDFYCKAEITRYKHQGLRFRGNMITIKIPLSTPV